MEGFPKNNLNEDSKELSRINADKAEQVLNPEVLDKNETLPICTENEKVKTTFNITINTIARDFLFEDISRLARSNNVEFVIKDKSWGIENSTASIELQGERTRVTSIINYIKNYKWPKLG